MRQITFREAIRETLRDALIRDPKVFIIGEDVGIFDGAFGCTTGLFKEFGPDRVVDTPMMELALPGIGVGAAMTGMKPVLEIMLMDWITICFDGIFNHAAKLFYISGGQTSVPMVVRTTMGAGRGAAAHHSQCLHALFMHAPGLHIAIPSTPHDAKGLLNSALEDKNPVLFVEHRELYTVKGDVPEGYYKVPFGQAAIRREGKDITIVATASMVTKALAVAEDLAGSGTSVEVIDPRTLCPLDTKTIVNSVKKTGRLVTVDEGCKTNGFGSEIAAIVAEEAIDYLQGPIIRIAGPMAPVGKSSTLESAFVPDEKKIKEGVTRVLRLG
jgi:pyruvate/2-oxoglutarate/acetoin dehydrogenase E1 component